MKIKMNEGHLGGSDIISSIKDKAYEYAFIISRL